MPMTIHDTIEQADAKRITKAELLAFIQRQNEIIINLSRRVGRLERGITECQ